MLKPKMMQDLSKVIMQGIKPMTTENKKQTDAIAETLKILEGGNRDSGMAKATKQLSGILTKVSKLVEAQNALLSNLNTDDLTEGGGDQGAEQAKQLEDLVKQITDENKKQAADLDKLMSEVEKAAKDGDDKDQGKKLKAAQQALEKASKLIDEQSKLLEEARKALG